MTHISPTLVSWEDMTTFDVPGMDFFVRTGQYLGESEYQGESESSNFPNTHEKKE